MLGSESPQQLYVNQTNKEFAYVRIRYEGAQMIQTNVRKHERGHDTNMGKLSVAFLLFT